MSSQEATISLDDIDDIKEHYLNNAFLLTPEAEWGVNYALNKVIKLIIQRM